MPLLLQVQNSKHRRDHGGGPTPFHHPCGRTSKSMDVRTMQEDVALKEVWLIL